MLVANVNNFSRGVSSTGNFLSKHGSNALSQSGTSGGLDEVKQERKFYDTSKPIQCLAPTAKCCSPFPLSQMLISPHSKKQLLSGLFETENNFVLQM